jgi:hypothetical protein
MLGHTRRIEFSGQAWLVRDSGGRREGPGPNRFADAPENVWLDGDGRLHLRVTRRGRAWHCAEVFSEQSFGHGRYTFYLDSRVDTLDPNAVCGLFTYLDDEHEIDIEFARWGNRDAHNASYVLQPAALARPRVHVPAGVEREPQYTRLPLAGEQPDHVQPHRP